MRGIPLYSLRPYSLIKNLLLKLTITVDLFCWFTSDAQCRYSPDAFPIWHSFHNRCNVENLRQGQSSAYLSRARRPPLQTHCHEKGSQRGRQPWLPPPTGSLPNC